MPITQAEQAEAVESTVSGPSGLCIEGTADSQIKITWNAVENATGYSIYYKIGNGSDYKLLNTEAIKQTTCMFSTTAKEGMLYIAVSATFADGTESQRTEVNKELATLLPHKPSEGEQTPSTLASPAISNYSIQEGYVTINWNAIEGARGYKVYRIETDKTTLLKSITTNTTTARFLSPKDSGTFNIAVVSVDDQNKESKLDFEKIKKITIDPLGNPVLSATNAKDGYTQLSWNPVENATGYEAKVYVDIEGAGDPNKPVTITGSPVETYTYGKTDTSASIPIPASAKTNIVVVFTAKNDAQVSGNVNFTVKLKASNPDQPSNPDPDKPDNPNPDKPNPPKNELLEYGKINKATAKNGQLTITWNKVPKATGLRAVEIMLNNFTQNCKMLSTYSTTP